MLSQCTLKKHFLRGENCALLGCYAVSSGNFLLTFRNNKNSSLMLDVETDRLSGNVGSELPLLAA